MRTINSERMQPARKNLKDRSCSPLRRNSATGDGSTATACWIEDGSCCVCSVARPSTAGNVSASTGCRFRENRAKKTEHRHTHSQCRLFSMRLGSFKFTVYSCDVEIARKFAFSSSGFEVFCNIIRLFLLRTQYFPPIGRKFTSQF